MTEHNTEPLWVGMDVEAELARYAEEDRRRGESEALEVPSPRRSSRRAGLRAAIPSLGRGSRQRYPLAV